LEDFSIANTEARRLSARFLNDKITDVAGSRNQVRNLVRSRNQVRSHQSEWPGDSSEAGLRQCQKWRQHRLGRLHEEKMEESSKL